jgi:hypothetical protein
MSPNWYCPSCQAANAKWATSHTTVQCAHCGQSVAAADVQSGRLDAPSTMNPYASPQASGGNYSSQYPAAAGGGKAVAALVLGIIGMVAWCIPLIGFPVNIVGLVLGCRSTQSPNRGMAIAGIVLCSIGLLFSALNAAAGVYLVLQQQQPMQIRQPGQPRRGL